MKTFEKGDFFVCKNKSIVRIVKVRDDRLKLRCIRPCRGKYSERRKIGLPYTFQRWSSTKSFAKRNPIRIGTEEILDVIFRNRMCNKNDGPNKL